MSIYPFARRSPLRAKSTASLHRQGSLAPQTIRRLSSWLLLSTALTLGLAEVARATTRTYDGGTTGTGAAIDTAANWSGDTLPGTGDDALFDLTLPTLPSVLTLTTQGTTYGDLLWNTNVSSAITLSGNISRNIAISGGAGSTGITGVGGATGDLIVMGTNATSSTLTIGGNANPGTNTAQLTLSLSKAGNFDVVNAGATLNITAAIAGAVAVTKTGAGTLILGGVNTIGGANVNFTITGGTVQMTGAGTLGSKYTDLVVNANLDLGGTTQTVDLLTGSGKIYNNTSGTTGTLIIGNDQGSTSTSSPNPWAGVISDNTNSGTGVTAITKVGNGTIAFSTAQTYSGATSVYASYIGTTNFLGTGGFTLSGNTGSVANSDVVLYGGSTFTTTSNAASGSIVRAKSVNLNSSSYTVNGNTTGNTVETITNALNFGSGRSTVTLAPGSGRYQLLNAGSLTRSAGATALFRGTNFGNNSLASATASTSSVTFTTAPTLSGSGAVGTNTVGIIPWAVGDASNSGIGTDFLTYDATNGLRRLTSAEYATTFADGNTTLINAKITSSILGLNGTSMLNSLLLGTGSRLNGTGTLSISSGAILAVDNTSIGTFSAGTLDFGAAEGILMPVSGKTLTIASSITGSGGLTSGGAGTVVLIGANSYTGGTYLSSGTLNINSDAALGAAGAPLIFTGGNLQAGASSITIDPTRSISSATTNVNAGFDTNGNTMTVAGVISGLGGINKLGNGTLNLSGVNTYSGATVATRGTIDVTGALTNTSSLVFAGGGMTLDFNGANAPATNLVNAGASLNFNIGPTNQGGVNTLTIIGKDNATSSQTFSSTTFANFASHLNLVKGAGTGALTVNLGQVGRVTLTTQSSNTSSPVGATLDITLPSGVTLLGSSNTTNGGIIIGTTINANTWAAVSGSSIIGLAAGSYVTNVATTTAGANLDVQASGTITVDPNTIRFNTAAPTTVTIAGTNNLRNVQAGGILVTSAVGANDSTITGGILAGIGRRDIQFIQNNTAGDLIIDAILTDNGGLSSDGITKSGAGRVILTKTDTLNGSAVINEGTLVVAGDYIAPVSKTGSINASSNLLTVSDTAGIFIGEKVTSTNTAELNSSANSLTWVVTAINGNVLTLSNNTLAATTSDTFNFSGGGGLGVLASSAPYIALGATLQIGNGSTTGSLFVGQAITDLGSVVLNRSDAYTFANVVSGTGSFTQAGSGVLTVTGTNTYTGATIVNDGTTLKAGNTSAFGVNSAVSVNGAGTLDLAGLNMTFGSLAGSGSVQNSSATAVTLTLGTDNTSPTFSGGIANGSSGVTSVTKTGTGNQTFSGNNTFTGTFSANGGTTTIAGGFNAPINAGGATGVSAIVRIVPGAAVNAHVASLNNAIAPGAGANSFGAIYQTGGTVFWDAQFVLGGGSGAYGFYEMDGGTLTDLITDSTQAANERFRLGGAASNSTAVFYQTGGDIILANIGGGNFEVGGNAGGPITGSVGVGYFTGGTLVTGLANHIGYDGSTGSLRGEETIAGTAQVTVNNIVSLGQATNDVGILNLKGGTYSVKQIVKGTSGQGFINFNGGTLKAATGANPTFLAGLTAATVYAGGGTIDTNGQNLTIGQALLTPSGSGVTTIQVVNGGTGYVGAPYISISGGGGNGATAVANMVDDGTGNGTYKIASITIISPGTNFTSAPTVTISGGGGFGTVLGTPALAANVSGGLTKTGAGTLTLSGANTFTGLTHVNQGTLIVGGSLAGSVDVASGATVGGTGTIAGGTIETGGVLLGGLGTGTGTLTSTKGISLSDGSDITLSLGLSGAHSTLAFANDGTSIFDNDQAFTFNYTSLAPGTYTNIITGLKGTETGLSTIGTWTITNPGVVGTFSYNGTGGINLTLTAVPEPSATTALFTGLGALLGLPRFRRRRNG